MSNEETVRDLSMRLSSGQISRRDFIRTLMFLGVSAATASALAACTPTPPAPTAAPAQPGGAAATPGATAASQAATGGPKRGGILRRGWQPPTQLDPAFQSSVNEITACAQFYDWFVWIDENNKPVPALATRWESTPDGLTWTFELRNGVTFHNGKTLTTDDVIFTFNRLRDKAIGAATVPLYANINEIKAVDSNKVQFLLAKPNPDLAADLGDYHACIVASDQKDFKNTYNGTGPFVLKKFSPEDRATFERNPNYWMSGMPYLDGVQDIYSPQQSSQVEALRGGELDVVMGLPAELAETLKKEGKTSLLIGQTNQHFAIHMRSDRGPAQDPRVRLALRLATDRAAILQAARLGYGEVGRDTPIGPTYGDFYLNAPEIKRDVARAKALLKEAGAENLKIAVAAQNSIDVPKIAVVWKEQLAEVGVTLDINVMPVDAYYQDDVWLQVDFGITDWGARATPQPYLQLAYMTGAKWNSSHWSDAEFDTLSNQAASELDRAKRAELYKKIQQIFIDRGPVIIPYFEKTVVATAQKVKGLVVHADYPRSTMRSVYME